MMTKSNTSGSQRRHPNHAGSLSSSLDKGIFADPSLTKSLATHKSDRHENSPTIMVLQNQIGIEVNLLLLHLLLDNRCLDILDQESWLAAMGVLI